MLRAFDTALDPRFSSCRPRTDEAKGELTQGYDGFSVTSPVTLVARGDVRVSYIDVAGFARTVGPFGKVCEEANDGRGYRNCTFSPICGGVLEVQLLRWKR